MNFEKAKQKNPVKKKKTSWVDTVHAFNPSVQGGGRGRWIQFEANLIYSEFQGYTGKLYFFI